MTKYTFTSESVSEGHPDKVCDIISDNIVDLFLEKDPDSRVAAETMVTTNKVVISGEVKGPNVFKDTPIDDLVRNTIKKIGYDQKGFDWKNVSVENNLHEQSKDIAIGVDKKDEKEQGAGDQGIMFGFACKETEQLMPAPIYYSHLILESLAEARHNGEKLLLPDSKSQVSLDYENGVPCKASAIVVSTQHDPSVSQKEIKEIVRPHVIKSLPDGWMCEEENFFCKPNWKICYWWTCRRLRANWKKNYSRYIWRSCTSWWRRFFRKRSYKSR